jgi:hypothetical protein
MNEAREATPGPFSLITTAGHASRATACFVLAVAAFFSSTLRADPDLEVRKCVDLAVAFQGIKLPRCSEDRQFNFRVDVTNRGPDEARNVIVDVSQTPELAPNLRFVDTGCSGTRCTVPAIGPGATATLQVRSGDFQNSRTRTLTFGLVASSADDYHDDRDDGTCG